MRVLRYLVVSLALAAALFGLAATRSSAAPVCTITWDGSAGTTSWHAPTNWNLDRVPLATDHVCIPAATSVTFSTGTTSILSLQSQGTLTLSGGTLNLTSTTDASNATTFNQSAGILGGAGTLTISVGGNWTGGEMVDAGTTTIAAAATLVQNGYTYLETGRRLDNAGTIELRSDKNMSIYGSPQPLLRNTGTIVKTAGVGTFTLYPELDNDGSVRSSSGTLSLYHNYVATSVSSGDFGAPAAAGKVLFDGGAYAVGDGARFLGGVVIDGGTVNVAGAGTLAISGTNGFTSGNLGGAGNANISGTFNWSGGSMRDAGTTTIAAAATLVQDGYTYLESGRLLDNAGLFELHSDKSMSIYGSPQPLLRNTGTIVKTAGVGTFTLYPELRNDGSMVSNAGTLSLYHTAAATSVSTGDFGAPAAPGKVLFDGGAYAVGNGARFLGGVVIDGGTVNVTAGSTLAISGTNGFTSGNLGGAGNANISGTFNWSGGSMRDAGTTTIAAAATLVQDGYTYLESGRLLDNAGLFELHSDKSMSIYGSPQPLLRNTGTIRKTAGAGEFRLYPALDNQGRVDSIAGKLSLRRSAAGAQSGTFSGSDDTAHVVFEADTFTLGGSARLLGSVEIGGAAVNVAPGSTLAIPGRLLLTSGELGGAGTVNVTGTLSWTGGTQAGPGKTVVPSGGNMSVNGYCVVYLRDGRLVENHGTMSILKHSSLGSYGTSRSVIDNRGLIDLNDGSSAGCGGRSGITGDLLLSNTGTLTKSGSTVAATQNSAIDGLDNDGTVDVKAGWLDLSSTSAVTQTGKFTSSGGLASTLAFSYGTFRMGPGATLAGQTAITGARVDVAPGNTLVVRTGDTLSMSDGTIGGDGTFYVAGAFKWTGGYHDGNGTTSLGPTAQATFDGSFYSLGLDDGRTLVNGGSIVWNSGDFWLGNGSAIVNAGTIELRGTTTLGGGSFSGWGYGSLFHNAGLLTKTGTTTATLQIPVDNDGTIEVSGGTLAINGQLLNYGAAAKTLTAGGYVVHSATLEVPADVALNASTIVLDSALSKVVYTDPDDDTIKLDALGPLAANAGAGEFTLDNRSLTTNGPLRNSGIVTLRHTSTLTSTGAYTQTGGITNLADAATRLTATGAKAQVNAGRFGGVGSVGPELAAAGGEVSPGLGATGILHADKYSSSGGATLRMQIGGRAAGTGFDQLAVAGAASLGGTLAIQTPSAFHPSTTDVFKIMTFASRTGTFAAVTGTALSGGLAYQVVYSGTDVTLHVVPAPAAPPPTPPVAPPVVPAAPTATTVDDAALAAISGPWTRKRAEGYVDSTFSIARRRGAALARAGVVAKGISIRVASCRRCGTIAVLWNGKVLRKIDLRSNGRQRTRVLQVAQFQAVRTGTVVIRVVSRGRPVVVDALVFRQS